jgi:hypothetical protein
MATFEEQYAAMIKRQLGGMLSQYAIQRQKTLDSGLIPEAPQRAPPQRGRDGYRTNKPSLPKLLSEF